VCREGVWGVGVGRLRLVADEQSTPSCDLATMVVPQVGRLVATRDQWEPYRLLDVDGLPVESVSAYFRELQATGKSAATARSYGMDLLRWFRFLWAVGVSWDQASRSEARDFSRWLQVAGVPVRPHWRHGDDRTAAELSAAAQGKAYSASVRAHSETVLRGFYDFTVMSAPGRS
jgi:hypothetical protein